MNYAAYLGAVDWRHPEWIGAFYPDDLPEDWLLDYYATQFRCVFLERNVWTAALAEELADWAAAVPEGFRFVLEGEPDSPAAQAAAVALGTSLGFVGGRDDARLVWFGAGDDLRALTAVIRAAAEPPYLISRDAVVSRLREVQTLFELLGL